MKSFEMRFYIFLQHEKASIMLQEINPYTGETIMNSVSNLLPQKNTRKW